jgi:hypothetical protein
MANEIFGDITNPSSLSRKPFYSRFTSFENTEDNYILIGFTPGLALQAAELNEIQDIYHKIDKLSNTMMSNWTLYALQNISNISDFTGIIWDGTIPLSPDMITVSGNFITFSSGWYYYNHSSGLNHWVYLTEDIIYDSSLDAASGFIGFSISTLDVFSSSDDRLYDNSSGSVNTNSPGAYRVNHNITGANFNTNANNTKVIIRKTNNVYTYFNGMPI